MTSFQQEEKLVISKLLAGNNTILSWRLLITALAVGFLELQRLSQAFYKVVSMILLYNMAA